MKKFIRLLVKLAFIFVIAIAASFFASGYLFPSLSTSSFFAKSELLRKFRENVTIINKTEQVTIKEDASVNKVASQAVASVVNIISISETQQPSSSSKTSSGAAIQSKSGTGVIITSDGLIATYRAAILESGATYKVLLSDGSNMEANLAGIDEFTNLAFIKIEKPNLSVIPFANSDDCFPGKKLIAIGNSFAEYQNRYASGLLSSVNKTFNISGKALSSSEKLEGVFETDIKDQKEYIGGPVIDYNSELIGITGSTTIDNQERYFLIPSNVVKASMELAIRNTFKDRPYLGLYYIPITKSYAIAHNLNRDRGALVYSQQGLPFIANSPAEEAGLKLNDIIIAINGQEVNLDSTLSNKLNQFHKGDSVEFLVVRGGQEIKLPVKL